VFALQGEKSRLGQEAPPEEDAELAELREETLRRGQGALAQKDAQTAVQRDEFEASRRSSHLTKGRLYTDFTDVEKSIYVKSALNLCGSPKPPFPLSAPSNTSSAMASRVHANPVESRTSIGSK
jgi:hypothetical protein